MVLKTLKDFFFGRKSKKRELDSSVTSHTTSSNPPTSSTLIPVYTRTNSGELVLTSFIETPAVDLRVKETKSEVETQKDGLGRVNVPPDLLKPNQINPAPLTSTSRTIPTSTGPSKLSFPPGPSKLSFPPSKQHPTQPLPQPQPNNLNPPLQVIPPATSSTSSNTGSLNQAHRNTGNEIPPLRLTLWDGYPKTQFQADFTHEQVARTRNLMFHWCYTTECGDRKGYRHAPSWELGLKTTRKCLGAVICSRDGWVERTNTKKPALAHQLTRACQAEGCNSPLKHVPCGVEARLWEWSGGVHFKFLGSHSDHPIPPKIHAFPDELEKFEAFVLVNSKAGPFELMVGVPDAAHGGKRQSVRDISTVYHNLDRVAKERRKAKKKHGVSDGRNFLGAFAEFDATRPGFIKKHRLGQVSVITVQSDFMRQQLVKESRLNDPAFLHLPAGTGLKEMFEALRSRKLDELGAVDLDRSRDAVRRALFDKGLLLGKTIGSPQPIWSWLWDSYSPSFNPEIPARTQAFFMMSVIEARQCTGALKSESPIPHLELSAPRYRSFFRLSRTDHKEFKGDLRKWFKAKLSIPNDFSSYDSKCWRGEKWCSGHRIDLRNLVTSIPVVLVLEMSERFHHSPRSWGSPKTVNVSTPQEATADGLVYDFVGLALYQSGSSEPQDTSDVLTDDEFITPKSLAESESSSTSVGHFIARFLGPDKRSVFTCNDMRDGMAIREKDGATASTHLHSKYPDLPKDFRIVSAVYILRGGINAQDIFFRLRCAELKEKFDITLSSNDLNDSPTTIYSGDDYKEIGRPERKWYSDQKKYSYKTAEYRSVLSGSTKLGRPRTRRLPSPVRISEPESEEEDDKRHTTTSESSAAGSDSEEDIPLQIAIQSQALDTKDSSTHRRKPAESPAPTMTPPPESVQPLEDNASSEPDSEFEMSCRCGRTGDGNKTYNGNEDGDAIQCDECKKWSHKACQLDGNASAPDAPFTCDICSMEDLRASRQRKKQASMNKAQLAKERRSERKREEAAIMPKKPLNERIRPGIGGLSRQGDYWYPMRVIHVDEKDGTCLVRWWRGCRFEKNPQASNATPGGTTRVPIRDVVDCLWQDRYGRRKIRLGRFANTRSAEMQDDYLLEHPEVSPYTSEVDDALSPATPIFIQILNIEISGKLEEVDGQTPVPALEWFLGQKRTLGHGVVEFPGALTLIERARIANWLEEHIARGDRRLRRKWLTSILMAHAITVFISYRMATGKRNRTGHLQPVNIQAAWERQQNATSAKRPSQDVDFDCQTNLERRMFERSSFAGVAGNCQWGLDSGDHEDRWDPYEGLESLIVGDRDGSDGELVVGYDYVYLKSPSQEQKTPEEAPTPRPKPRPIKRRKVKQKSDQS